MLLKPPKLEEGQTIGVIGPAGPMDPDRLQRGLAYLKGRGYRVKVAEHVSDRHGYFAGEDRGRAMDVNAMFTDPDVHAVFCSRGGYGTQRILASLDYHIFRKTPKIMVGFSDITVLHLALFSQSQVVSFAGPMVAVEMANNIDRFTEESLWSMLTTADTKRLQAPDGRPLTCLRPGQGRGPLLGGCLSLVVTVIGTRYEPDWRGAILFLEEVGEEPYRVDRNLMHLKQAGVFEKISGLVFGDFESCVAEEPESSLTIDETIAEIIDDLTIPVAAGLPYGHIGVKHTIPVGVEAVLDAGGGFLELTESPVA